MNFISFVEFLKKNLQAKPLPGQDAQYLMASDFYKNKRIDFSTLKGYKPSAVCLLLYPKNDSVCFLLIKRPSTHRFHAGQIALPGGSCEPGEDFEQTALRELHEEAGIKISSNKILGRLSPLYIPVSNFYIQPVVAHAEDNFSLSKTNEVEEFIEFPLIELLNENLVGKTQVKASSQLQFVSPYFNVNGNVLWGATAMLLSEMKQLLLRNEEFILPLLR